MWECKYGEEPLDTRLCFLRLIGKSWLVAVMALAGVLLFGGIYFIANVVYGPEREYVTESQFYIEYVNAVTQEQQYTFYNKETWESLIHTDIFMDEVMAHVTEQTGAMDREITRDEVRGAIFATLLTDVRIVHVTVNTNSPELTMIITDGLEKAFVTFGESQREIDAVRAILIPEDAVLTVFDNRIVRACILGAVVFVAFTLFFMYLYVVLDTSIYIPLEFERRYGIPMEAEQAQIPDDKDADAGEETGVQKGEVNGNVQSDSVYACETTEGNFTLYVKSKDHNGPLIEKTIRDLHNEGKTVTKAVLTQADDKLIKWYFKTGKIL